MADPTSEAHRKCAGGLISTPGLVHFRLTGYGEGAINEQVKSHDRLDS
jgi:hypothetical protein